MLDFHKIINTEEKRRGVEALGAEMVGKLTYYERWIVAFANILFQKGILTPERAGAEDGRGRGALARGSRGCRHGAHTSESSRARSGLGSLDVAAAMPKAVSHVVLGDPVDPDQCRRPGSS